MNWDAIGAIGQICGVILTFVVGCIAMLPYMRKCSVYFCFMINTKKQPAFVVTNNSQKGQFINRIIMYSGKWSRKPFVVIDMWDVQDDLLARNTQFFIAPNSYIQIYACAGRMIEYITQCDVSLHRNKNVYVQLDFGDKCSRRYCTKMNTRQFLKILIDEADAFKHMNVDTLFN